LKEDVSIGKHAFSVAEVNGLLIGFKPSVRKHKVVNETNFIYCGTLQLLLFAIYN
jgi:hypothetical protein